MIFLHNDGNIRPHTTDQNTPRSKAHRPHFTSGKTIVREANGLPDVLGRSGTMEVRLARTVEEIRAAQRLRYRVFYKEMSAKPNVKARIIRRDIDAFDRYCDHLLVIDRAPKQTSSLAPQKPKVVGTYRLLRQNIAEQNNGFYTANEFDLTKLLKQNQGQRLLELGRSCVLKDWRNKKTVELLWEGLWRYIQHHKIDVMFGCASLEGTDCEALALPLSFLHHHASMPLSEIIAALPHRFTNMDLMAKDQIDMKKAMKALPPLIKAYLRLGAHFGNGAVVDKQFGTTDVFVHLRTKDIDPRYISYYSQSVQ